MTLSNLEQSLQQQVEQEAKKILDEARGAAEARFERESARMREEHERRIAATRAELEGALERETSARETADRLKLLQIKNEIIETVFGEAVGKIRALPNDGYAEWMRRQIAGLPAMAGSPAGSRRLAVNERDTELAKRLLAEPSQDSGMSLDDKPARMQAGFVVRGEHADLDYSVEALLGVLREKLAQQVATRLFGEEAK